MKTFRWLLYLVCTCALFAACHDDDEPIYPPEEDNNVLFAGENKVITLQEETKSFRSPEYRCKIMAGDGREFSRIGDHVRLEGLSILTFQTGLKPGIYRLLALEYPELTAGSSDTTWVEYGLGCRVEISNSGEVKILDSFNSSLNFSGKGTKEDPYIISSYSHLKNLRNIINDQRQNSEVTRYTYFKQVANIDMDKASWDSDHNEGWYPIGAQPTNPYRGVYDGNGYSIKNLWSNRPNSSGIALFGFVEQAYIKNVKMVNPKMEGNYAVGSLVGASVTAGDRADTTFISSCSTTKGYIKGGAGSVGNGGLIGVADMKSVLLMDSCINENTNVSGDYAVGGLLGAGSLYSYANVQQSENHASVSSMHTGAGGLVGSADSLFVLACVNTGSILGATQYDPSDKASGGFGTGGIAGGTGMSFIHESKNTGSIKGHTGVGGIIGSTRIGSDELLFNNTLVKGSSNEGSVEGQTAVGGICGESQFGAYMVYNTGSVTALGADAHVGGIVGNTSIAVVHNVLNDGVVSAASSHCAGGVIGKTTWGAVFACQNYGDMKVSADYAGGVIGLAGNYTMVNYCSNLANIHNSGKGPTGGVIGEIGDPREWSAMDIVGCVLGSVECVLGVAGPLIAVTGDALKGSVSTTAKVFGKLTHVLHMAETGLEYALLATDASLFLYGIYEMVDEQELQLMKSSLQAKTSEIAGDVAQAMSNIRSGRAWSISLLSDGLTPEVAQLQLANTNNVLSFYEQSDENNTTVNFNINNKREERYKEIEKSRKIQSIVQKCIAGACCVAGTALAIASMVVTAGTSAAAIVAVAAPIVTVVGGANAVIEGATDYQNNAVVVSQCFNVGEIKVDKVDKVGGVLGHAQQFCEITDCVNAGPFNGKATSKTGGVVGRADSRSVIKNCLNVGKNWNYVIYSRGDAVTTSNLYYYDPYLQVPSGEVPPSGFFGKYLTLDKLYKEDTYKDWAFSGNFARWQVKNSKGYFPVPYHSEMEETIEQ